ncbi:MAG: chromosomal replication initiator protein DnaA [Pseudoflavonifractor sp.]|nr:chromosomal replication initiator protein DnaA [Alloprevotella sp.]MCM1116579.1 chromosomal replication initiator protein DnaA [Pseudoflavonifractor sp.]
MNSTPSSFSPDTLSHPIDRRALWDDCLRIFRDNLMPEQYKAWFEPITCVSCSDTDLVLRLPSPYFMEQFEEQYRNLIGRTLVKVYGPGIKLSYEFNQVGNDPSTAVRMADSRPSAAVKPRQGVTSNPFQSTQQTDIDPQLNPRYTFENYCGSQSNIVARTIGEAIGDNPKCKTYNPLFVYGAPGVGKTHLIQAIGIRIKEKNPSARVLYITARLFESQYTTAVRQGKINDFINFYQSIDTLIIDDIQDLIGKSSTQNTFFHIFNHLHQNQKQLILSSDCRPSQMEGMEGRLLSRFKWGATAELEKPDYQLRLAALHQRAAQDGLTIPTEVLDFIAASVTDSIRELEGIVVSLLAHATVLNCDITLDLAKKVLGNSVRIRKKSINFEMVANAVSDHYGITPEQLFTKSRKREISDARQVVMYMAKKHAGLSLQAIGTRLSRTHATVLYGCNTIEQRLGLDKQLRDDLDKIEAAILAS